jgi:phospholipase C
LEEDLAKKKKQGIVNPTRLPSFDREKKVQVVIETPKGRAKHVIVIMQENHSFDNYFGSLAYAPDSPYHSPTRARRRMIMMAAAAKMTTPASTA